MKGYAVVYRFLPALLGLESDMPANEAAVIDETTATGKKEATAKKRNSIAIAHLTMTMMSELALSLVYESQTFD